MNEIVCPHCQGLIYDDDALLCHFCGESLRRKTQGGVLGQMRAASWGWFFVGIVVILVLISIVVIFM